MANKRNPYSLIGVDGNIFAVMGYTVNAMRECGYSNDAIQCYKNTVLGSKSYDEALAASCRMVDNCNVLSGYDENQQLMKGHDNLNYVNGAYGVNHNKREKLIDEAADWGDYFAALDRRNKSKRITNFNKHYEEFGEKEISTNFKNKDYTRLYEELSRSFTTLFNNMISNDNLFTKKEVKEALFDSENSIFNDDKFWKRLKKEIPDYNLNESRYSHLEDRRIMVRYLRGCVNSRLFDVLHELIRMKVEFSKYDVYHALMQMINSPRFWAKLDIYIPEE